MKAIEPTLTSLLEFLGLSNTPDGIAAINAYNAALTAVENWTPGTAAANALQLIGDFQTIFNTLPLPTTVTVLANIILAGIEAVIGVINANEPAPTAPAGTTATPEETQVHWQHAQVAATTAKVAVLVPSFKRSIWHSAEHQYVGTWNGAVEKGGFPTSMKV
jgi:hypothetical protein